ncbi:MAG: PIN domain protein [Candidatus Argoarchaeum ethanivorans]|uniref:PIN domain protein n=1 Tax=Candidatus Argoarchaeum ethanivorans TaxID=2608793 RepID=A0A811TC66_9EURY|nr:MAG: PIN domain protein [Candidatus Argoarchaeum ethanivorans]
MGQEKNYMIGEISLIDTNMLAYAYDESEGEKHEICKRLIDGCWRLREKYGISIQNLSEFYVIITKKIENPVPKETAKEIIGDIIEFQNWIVIDYDARTILSAIEINMAYGVHYWDALIAATMREHNIFSIFTEDSDFKNIPWLKVVNPFESMLE